MDLFIAAYVLYAVLQAWWCANFCVKMRQIELNEHWKAFLAGFLLAPVYSCYILWCLFLNWRDSKK